MKTSKLQRINNYLKNKIFYLRKQFSFSNSNDDNIIYLEQWKRNHRKVS